MKPRNLCPYPLDDVLKALAGDIPALIITMSEGQWDRLLSSAYDHGFILLELDANEKPLRAYRKELVQ